MLTITNAVINKGQIAFTIPETIDSGAAIATFEYAHIGDMDIQLFLSGADEKQFSVRGNQLIFNGDLPAESQTPEASQYDIHIFVRVLESGTDKAIFSRVFATDFTFIADSSDAQPIALTDLAATHKADDTGDETLTQHIEATSNSKNDRLNAGKERGLISTTNSETVYRIVPVGTGMSIAIQTYLLASGLDTSAAQTVSVKTPMFDANPPASDSTETVSRIILERKPSADTESTRQDSDPKTAAPDTPPITYTDSAEQEAAYIPHINYIDTDSDRPESEDSDNRYVPVQTDVVEQDLIEITGSFKAYEDGPAQNPAGRIELVDPNRADYLLTVNEVPIVENDVKVPAIYGSLIVNQDGTWEYNLDNTNASVEALQGTASEVGHILVEYIAVTYTGARSGATEILQDSFTISIEGKTDHYGGSGSDSLVGGSNADSLHGQAGDDELRGGGGDDTLDGGIGLDTLQGDEAGVTIKGNDIFVLHLGDGDNIGLDIVRDFTQGQDKIRIDTPTGTETTLDALKAAVNIRWEIGHAETKSTTNDPDIADTLIYDTRGTVETSDDIVRMVLEDFNELLTIDHFDIV